MPTRYPRALVVGASSGIGLEIARQLAAEGARVVAVARREERLRSLARETNGAVIPLVHDATDYAGTEAAFVRATDALEGLDLVVYSSGVMPRVGPMEFDFAKDQEMFAVNVLGAMAWLDLAAVRFAAQGGGTLVAIGSVAGDRGRRGQPAYNASKAALHAYAEALRNRLWSHGVTVTTVKPGPVDTEMTAGMGFKGALSAQEAARRTLRLAPSGKEVYLQLSHRVIFGVIRALPSSLFRRVPI